MAPFIVLFTVVGLVLILEGALSFASMIRAVSERAEPLPSAHRFTAHDPILGWKAEQGIRDAGAYGEWRPLTTNDASLRHADSVAEEPGEGVVRVVCAGGSGVFGVNVADQETWCSRLGHANASVETINAGQPAFGLDQTWLLLRDRLNFRHDLLLVALDGSDLFKLVANEHTGFPKPRLRPGESGLEVLNTPIPGRPFWVPWVTFNAAQFSESHLVSSLLYRPPGTDVDNPSMGAAIVMSALVPELQALAESHDSELAVVYLPSHPTYEQRAEQWRRSLASELSTRQIPFIDLSRDSDKGPSTPDAELFNREGLLTAQGHQWIARALARELVALESPELPAFEDGPWQVQYFGDVVFQQFSGMENHGVSALYWGEGAPLPGLPANGFSVILESCLPLDAPRRVRVRLEADGPATFSVNDQTILDTGNGEGQRFGVNAVEFPAGDNRLRVRYRDTAGPAAVRLLFRMEDGTVVTPGSSLLEAPGAGICGA
jgi:hypothetical protein